jgi:fatty acid amide hydrolase
MTDITTRYLAPQNDPLLSASATQLATRIAAGEVSAQEVVAAYISRIEELQAPLNALAVPLFDQARKQAIAADQALQRGEPLGPLHGLPITVKECYHVAGTASSLGLKKFANETIAEDGPLVRRLRAAGAIIVGKTNLPQAKLLHETDNPLFGRTNNPWNVSRSPGGSSGGEAALLAAGGSTLGLANDLGGSIRIPAHFCGVCGIKPTSGRLTNLGCRNNLSGLKVIATQSGALARSVADVSLMLRVLCTRLPDEPVYADESDQPLRDSQAVDIGRLRIGIMEVDGVIWPAPAVRRAVNEAAQALQSRGVQVESFPLPNTETMLALYLALLGADGARALSELLRGGQVDRRVGRLAAIGRMPRTARRLLARIAHTSGQQTAAFMLRATGRKTAEQVNQLALAVSDYRQRLLDMLEAQRLDAILLPPHALPALTHGASLHLPLMASYSFLANLVGLPAGVVPWTTVHPGEETDRPRSWDAAQRTAKKVEQGSAGLPVGVQIMARPWREDVVLAVMAALEEQSEQATSTSPQRSALPRG